MTDREIPPGSAVVSPNDMLEKIEAVLVTVTKIDTTLQNGQYDSRLRALEKRMWAMGGAATVLGGALGAIGNFIVGGS